jgi:hypothetical protein
MTRALNPPPTQAAASPPLPELASFSILFPDAETAVEPRGQAVPDPLPDLNLDQVFAAIAANRRDYELSPFFTTLLRDERAVAYRQSVFVDLETGLSGAVEAFAAQMRHVRSYLTASSQRTHRYGKAAWFLDAARIHCDALTSLRDELAHAHPASESLRRFSRLLDGYLRSEGFGVLDAETRRLQDELGALRFCVRVHDGRVTVSDFHGEPDYSTEVLATFEKFRTGNAKSRLVEFRHDFANHVQEMIVDRVAILHPDLFHSLLAYHERYADLVDPVIARFEREAQVYLGYLGFIQPLKEAGLSFCLPEVSLSAKEHRASDTFDLALAGKLVAERRPVVVNDLELRGAERVLVVSGPNQGGKTTIARAFGQLHHLAALGFPVPGTSARLLLCDRVLTHFAKQEQIEDLHSGLENELLRIRAMIEQATGRSIVVMNESFASTTAEDQLLLGRRILKRLIGMDVLAVYVTFIDELSRLGPSVVSMLSTVAPDNPAQRTFKVVRRPADGRAYAMVLAEAHGLSYAAVTERLHG